MNGTVFTAATLPLTAGVPVFLSALPSVKDVRKATPADATMRRDLRVGEATAILIVLMIGAMSAHFVNDAMPLVTAAIVCIGLVAMYESILFVTPPERII